MRAAGVGARLVTRVGGAVVRTGSKVASRIQSVSTQAGRVYMEMNQFGSRTTGFIQRMSDATRTAQKIRMNKML